MGFIDFVYHLFGMELPSDREEIYCKQTYRDAYPKPLFDEIGPHPFKSSIGFMSSDYKNNQHRYYWQEEHDRRCNNSLKNPTHEKWSIYDFFRGIW